MPKAKEFRFSSYDHRDEWARNPERALVEGTSHDEILDGADVVTQPICFLVALSRKQLDRLVWTTRCRRGLVDWPGEEKLEGICEPEQARLLRRGHSEESCEVLGELIAEALDLEERSRERRRGEPRPRWRSGRFSWSPAAEDDSAPVAIPAPGTEAGTEQASET